MLTSVLGALVGAATACTANATEPARGTSVPERASSATSSATSSTEAAGRRAVEVYLGMWANLTLAARTSDWRSPLLSEFATGDALTTISDGLYADHQNGLVTLGAPKNAPSVSSVDPTADPARATIADCGDSTGWREYRVDTGQPADGGSGGRHAITATVAEQWDGAWLVTDLAVQPAGTC